MKPVLVSLNFPSRIRASVWRLGRGALLEPFVRGTNIDDALEADWALPSFVQLLARMGSRLEAGSVRREGEVVFPSRSRSPWPTSTTWSQTWPLAWTRLMWKGAQEGGGGRA